MLVDVDEPSSYEIPDAHFLRKDHLISATPDSLLRTIKAIAEVLAKVPSGTGMKEKA